MIEELLVKNYILFDEARIDFRNNMSVITGETGAGKSLLIDAIGYLSGDRLVGDPIRKGKDKAVLQMILSNPSAQALELLEENGIDAEDEIIITRTISKGNKSRMMVNSQATTNAFVKKLVSLMIDVHSQMDTIRLMDEQVQLDLLDQYAQAMDQRARTAEAFKVYSKIALQLKKLQNETFSDAELEFVTAQLNEINAISPKEGELDKLSEEIKVAESSAKNNELFSEAVYLLSRENGGMDQVYQASKLLKKAEGMQESADKLLELYYSLSEIADELKEARENGQSLEQDLDEMQDREFALKRLYKKYGGTFESLQEAKKELEEKIDRILHRQDLFDKLEKERLEARDAYLKEARRLSEMRQAAFPSLKEKIEANAKDLMLEHCVFEIRQEKAKKASKDGMDIITFMVSMNPGQPLSPLSESASGGELSRLMLALKVVFQAQNGIGTLVFDEIDTGVSGKVALAMGNKMHDLARNYQVLCITHLPSVAVWADDHYRVAKSSDGNSTETHVEKLDEQKHLEELAIMAHGSATEKSIASMRDLVAEVRHG